MNALQAGKFAVFGGSNKYEPSGGLRDYMGSYETLAQAVAFAEGYTKGNGSPAWARVNDAATGEEIAEIEA